jgi:hypothetical protein
MLRRRLIFALRAEPETGIDGLRRKFPNAKVRDLTHALSQLAAEGFVEMHKPGKYRRLPSKMVVPAAVPPSDFIRPIPIARLMAGR